MGFFGRVRDRIELEKAKARSRERQREVNRQEREAQERLQLDLDAKAARAELKKLKKSDKDRKAVAELEDYKNKGKTSKKGFKMPGSRVADDFNDFLGYGPGSKSKKKSDRRRFDEDDFDPFKF